MLAPRRLDLVEVESSDIDGLRRYIPDVLDHTRMEGTGTSLMEWKRYDGFCPVGRGVLRRSAEHTAISTAPACICTSDSPRFRSILGKQVLGFLRCLEAPSSRTRRRIIGKIVG
jgi:hypothetical protein